MVTQQPPVPSAPSNPPNETIYVKNLEERIKVDQLKEALEELFSEYGTILEIVAKTNLKAKGQAFVVFDSVDAATNAIEEIQGFELFEKPLVLDFARTKSDATVQREGDEDALELHKRRRRAEKERKQASEAAEAEKKKRPADLAAGDASARPLKARGGVLKSTNPTAGAVIPEEYLPPNKTLFLQNLGDDVDQAQLTAVFGAFEGFKEVRTVPGRKGIAFVEYEAEAGAISAKERTANMPLGQEGKIMKVVYQRK